MFVGLALKLLSMTNIDRKAELVLNANSEARQTLKVIANRWVSIILCALGNGNKRYSELDDVIEGLSQRMLTRTLKDLERNGIIERVVLSQHPVKVEYALTSLGKTLYEPLHALCAWAETHMTEVKAARVNYNSRAK
jgi:DNA-binding HxlR family transcriptional regulator